MFENNSAFGLEAPWYSYQKALKELFALDPMVEVGEIEDIGNGEKMIKITLSTHEKFMAFHYGMNLTKMFGKVKVNVVPIDATYSDPGALASKIFSDIFDGNRRVKDFQSRTNVDGSRHGYIRFWPEIIQFNADDTSSFDGIWCGLAQDIAREAFNVNGVYLSFCTARTDENGGDEEISG